MDRVRLKLFVENAKAFLLSKLSREAFVFLFFVVVSAIFWLMQALNESYDMEIGFDLQLTGVPEGVVITTELPSPIHVTVHDKGNTLWNYYHPFKGMNTLEVDFGQYDRGANSGHVLLPHADVNKLIAKKLQSSTRITLVRPDTLEFYYTRGVKKVVPVVFKGQVETNPLYYLAGVQCMPDSVVIWAEEHLLDSLAGVVTTTTQLTDLTATTECTVPLVPIKGVKMEPREVTLRAEVDVYTEKRVTVPIVGTNFPGGYSLRTFPSSATISFRVGVKDYARITEESFVLTTTYEELMARPDSSLHLQLRSIPEGVSQVRIQPEVVQFLIEEESDDE